MSTRSTTEPKSECAPSGTAPDAAGNACPSPESILSLVSGRPPSAGDLPVLRHLAQCPSCRAALSFTAAAALRLGPAAAVPEERPVRQDAAAFRLAQRLALWQRRLERGADAIAAGVANEGLLVFRSAEGTPPERAWKAELVLTHPDGAAPVFSLRMLPSNGRVPSGGHFVLFGVSSPVREGSAVLPPDILANAAFAAGGVAFVDADGAETAGVPVLDDFC